MMKRIVLPVLAATTLLSATANPPAAGQTYNPYITVDVPESSKAAAPSLRGTGKKPKSGAAHNYGSYRLVFPTTKSGPKKRRLQAR